MSYYMMGDYYLGSGDPGILSSIGRIGGSLARALIPGVGVASDIARAILPSRPRPTPPRPPGRMPGIALPFVPPAKRPGYAEAKREAAGLGPRRRRMNVANPKALRRAIRREQGFVKLASKALKGTGYVVKRRGSAPRRPTTIVETGPGSVHTR